MDNSGFPATLHHHHYRQFNVCPGRSNYICYTDIYYYTYNNRQELIPHTEDVATTVIAVNTGEDARDYYPH